MATVVMLVTTKNPTKKTLMKVTMSMMTTMTTVLHRVLLIDKSSYPYSTCTIWFAYPGCSLGLAVLLHPPVIGLCDRCIDLCSNAFHQV